MSLECFQRALSMCGDDNMGDVWFNIGQVAIGIGDLGLAYQAFKIATSVESSHADSYNNLGAPSPCKARSVGLKELTITNSVIHSIPCGAPHPPSVAAGVLELRKNNLEAARSNFRTAGSLAPHMFEPFFNAGVQ